MADDNMCNYIERKIRYNMHDETS